MNNSPLKFSLLVFALFAFTHTIQAQTLRDGALFDQGRSMDSPSPRAHPDTHKLQDYLGKWDVTITRYPTDSTTHVAQAQAEVTYMNRGYGYMERLHAPAYDDAGVEANVISFLNFSPLDNVWVLGEANSYFENITMHNGVLENGVLTLKTAIRRGGGVLLNSIRTVYTFAGPDAFEVVQEMSTDGQTWNPEIRKKYSRHTANDFKLATRTDHGMAAPDRAKEAAQFDFLLGRWNANHEILLGGNWVRFPANATAIHAMNGYAILEHNWYDVDPSLPDAATSIIRIYNRAMRRWECLYVDNRSNKTLHFGGRQEGDEIVLLLFESDTGAVPMPRYIFHNINTDSYSWYAKISTDRGKTFNKSWVIEFARQQKSE